MINVQKNPQKNRKQTQNLTKHKKTKKIKQKEDIESFETSADFN